MMSINLVHTNLKGLYEIKILDRSHHGYLGGCRSSTPSMLVINYRTDAEEKQMTSEQSSFDAKKAYESTKNLLFDWWWRK